MFFAAKTKKYFLVVLMLKFQSSSHRSVAVHEDSSPPNRADFVFFFPGIFYYAQDMFLYYPDQPPNSRIFVELPNKLHLPYENTSIKTSDGVNLNAVLIKHASPGAPTVILLHGNAGNIGHR